MSTGSKNVIDLAIDDPVSRTTHQYMVDAFTHSFIQNRHSEELSNAIFVREKNYYYSSTNTPLQTIEKVGRPKNIYGKEKGDLDFAVIYLEDEHIDHFEITESERSAESKRHHPDEQIERVHESIKWTNKSMQTDWSYDHDICLAEDSQLDFGYNPPTYTGEQFCSQPVYEQAKKSEQFEALNKSLFKDNFWSEKIRKQEDFR